MPHWIDSSSLLSLVSCVTPRRPGFYPLAPTLTHALMLGLSGCASGPREQDRLPDEGPTTLQIYEQHLGGAIAGSDLATSGPPESAAIAAPPVPGEPIAPLMTVPSRRSHEALTALQDDFQRLPNPEILGYVYPHLSGDLPVPGYYTVFPLREGTAYAQPGEGDSAGSAP